VHEDYERRRAELRADAAALLGRVPADDPAAELRALRVEHPDALLVRDDLHAVLAGLGVDAGADPRAAARAFLTRPAAAIEAPPPVEDTPLYRAYARELADLEGERHANEAGSADIAAAIERVESFDRVALPALEAEAVVGGIDALLDGYRAAELLAGRLPLVLDGALDDLADEVVPTVARALASVEDVQIIVVTARPRVARALGAAGATAVAWPGSTDEATPCAGHPLADSVDDCTQCGRPCCLECLVYVPGEGLWCTACAELPRPPYLRLLRRRKA
jgi:hypothetical protein